MSSVHDSNPPSGATHIYTSTPFRETVPTAALFLNKEWKPSFMNEENLQGVDSFEISAKDEEFEKAFASLSEILSTTSTDNILDLYSSKLAAYKEQDDKKFDEMLSKITSDKESLFLEFENEADNKDQEVDKYLEEISEQSLNSTLIDNVTVIPLPHTETLVPRKDDTVVLDEPVEKHDSSVSAPENKTDITDVNHQPKENLELNHTDKDETNIKSPVTKILDEFIEKEAEEDKENEIIDGDDGVPFTVEEEEELLNDDEQPLLKKLKDSIIVEQPVQHRELEEFVSNDPDENRDNNDPKWNYLRNLGSDFERYQAVRARWKNLEIPNPKKDLTCRCRKVIRKNGFTNDCNDQEINEYENNMKRLLSSDNEYYRPFKKPRRESCTVVFDRCIEALITDVERERRKLVEEQEANLNRLADSQRQDQIHAHRIGANDMQLNRMKRKHYEDTEKLIKNYRRKLEDITENARTKIDALRKAGDEVRQFHEFYPSEDATSNDKNSFVYLTETEVQEILEIENMLLQFEEFYPTPQ